MNFLSDHRCALGHNPSPAIWWRCDAMRFAWSRGSCAVSSTERPRVVIRMRLAQSGCLALRIVGCRSERLHPWVLSVSQSGLMNLLPWRGAGGVDSEWGAVRVERGADGVRESSVPSSRFSCEPKTAVKKDVFLKKKVIKKTPNFQFKKPALQSFLKSAEFSRHRITSRSLTCFCSHLKISILVYIGRQEVGFLMEILNPG